MIKVMGARQMIRSERGGVQHAVVKLQNGDEIIYGIKRA